jgi:MFS family permease
MYGNTRTGDVPRPVFQSRGGDLQVAMKPLTGDDGVNSTSEIVDPVAAPRRKLLSPRQALVVSSVASLVALVIEMKSLMVIPMTGTFIREVGLTPFAAGWILLSTQLVGVATTGLLARMGDVVGHRKILLYVLLGQLVGNALTGLAVDTVMVIIGRGLVGLSAATALLLAVMRDWMGPKELRQGIGFISGIQGIGVSISFLFGGLFLAAGFSWRSVFLICAVLSLLCLLTVWKWVPETVSRARVKLDYIGAVGLGVWLCLLLVAISKSTSWGLLSMETIGCLVGTAVICALWIVHERRHPEPLVNISVAFGPRLLPAFIATATMAFAAFICYIGITNFVQVARDVAGYGFGYTVLQGGLVLLPGATIIGLMSMVTGRLVGRFGARMLMAAGSLVMSVTFFYWYWNRGSSSWAPRSGASGSRSSSQAVSPWRRWRPQQAAPASPTAC